jgi:peptidyl-prolyl cis-trans isomerase D
MKYREKFAAATNDSSFVYSRTRNKFDPKKYVPLKDLPAGAKDSVKLVAPKTVFGPIKDGDAYKLYKLIDRKQGGTVNANVRQIVIRAKSPSAADSAAALSEASAIKAIVNAQNFGQIASEKSQDQSKMSGGSIGWVSTPSQYGAAFDEAVKSAPKGAIVGPIKGNQGYHILLIEDKTDETFLVAEFCSKSNCKQRY